MWPQCSRVLSCIATWYENAIYRNNSASESQLERSSCSSLYGTSKTETDILETRAGTKCHIVKYVFQVPITSYHMQTCLHVRCFLNSISLVLISKSHSMINLKEWRPSIRGHISSQRAPAHLELLSIVQCINHTPRAAIHIRL